MGSSLAMLDAVLVVLSLLKLFATVAITVEIEFEIDCDEEEEEELDDAVV